MRNNKKIGQTKRLRNARDNRESRVHYSGNLEEHKKFIEKFSCPL